MAPGTTAPTAVTPWGTYLACEENFNGYFSVFRDARGPWKPVSLEQSKVRYGVKTVKDWGYAWAQIDDRFDIAKEAERARNRAGYVVEIDPSDPTSTPKKRTALGRMKHENAELVVATRTAALLSTWAMTSGASSSTAIVSNGTYSVRWPTPKIAARTTARSIAAKFNEDGTGQWMEL